MFDTMTLTKTAGALCGALLIFLMANWASHSIFSIGGGHGDEHVQGFVIDTGAEEAEEEVTEEGPSLAELMAAADPANGETLFRNCAACHSVVEGENKVGPHLYGVVGRAVGSVESYASYSGALTAVAEVWTPVELNAFLENPKGFAPGTSMGYNGLRKPTDRADMIAYLDQLDGTTFEMPLEEAAAEEAPADEGASEEAAAEEAAPAEEAPAEEAAAAETPAEEAAAEETPAEETPAEEGAPAEEAPAEEGAAATQEAPAEEAAAEAQAAAEETAAAAPAAEPAAEAAGASEAAAGADFAALLAAADIAAGEKIFRRCGACHKVEDGKNGAGPHLFGVVGRDIASVDGFNYSDALKGQDGVWTPEKLNAWITNPREFAPGNRMGFPGLKDETDRANLIGYLQSVAN